MNYMLLVEAILVCMGAYAICSFIVKRATKEAVHELLMKRDKMNLKKESLELLHQIKSLRFTMRSLVLYDMKDRIPAGELIAQRMHAFSERFFDLTLSADDTNLQEQYRPSISEFQAYVMSLIRTIEECTDGFEDNEELKDSSEMQEFMRRIRECIQSTERIMMVFRQVKFYKA